MTKHKRRRFIVDWRNQFAMTAQLLGVLFGVGLLYAVGLLVLPDDGKFAELSPEEARDIFLKANAIYFALGAAILSVVSILLTHRWAGPAFVLDRVVRGIRTGDYSQRAKLRKRDYLQALATSLELLREDLQLNDKRLADLARCLEEGDTAAAKELVAAMRKKATSEEKMEAEEAPAEEPEAETVA